MKCSECVGKSRRDVDYEVTLPIVPGARAPLVVTVCHYHVGLYEAIEGASIRRVGSDLNLDAFEVMRRATDGR